uniref:Tf2-1-like SH3-like domain-containing protein n=1 Tax=Nicotiana tabacum TaxID=4097 RepID=A0A1S3ZDP0_TOBAC|nr:uncharacterized protein LOC104097314 [Nicotiana tomentosiformis]XP_016462580.1 PREDICTED: uncharacterized protein LOC107785726 [Nicotiana tabacum]
MDTRTPSDSSEQGEKVLLKASPMKSVMSLGEKGKLSPLFIGPLEVLEGVGEVSYKLSLPPSLSGVHLVFCVSVLRRYNEYRSHVLDFRTVHLDEHLSYKEVPIPILDREFNNLRSKEITSMKVLLERTTERECYLGDRVRYEK